MHDQGSSKKKSNKKRKKCLYGPYVSTTQKTISMIIIAIITAFPNSWPDCQTLVLAMEKIRDNSPVITRLINPDLGLGSFIASSLPLVYHWSTPGLPLVCRTGFFYSLLTMSLPPHFLLLKTLNCNDFTALHCFIPQLYFLLS